MKWWLWKTQQLRNQFRMHHPNDTFGKQQQLCNQELRDGWHSRTLWWVDEQISVRKGLNDEQTRLARRFTASTKTEGKVRTTKLVSRKVESDQGGLMSYGTCHTLPPVFLLSSSFFLHLLNSFDALLWIQGFQRFEFEIFSSNSLCFSLALRVSLVFDALHTVLNSVYVQTLPTEQATSVVTLFFAELWPLHSRL